MAKVINYRPADLRTSVPGLAVGSFRPKGRVLAPEAFDPGQVIDEVLYRGVVWALGPEQGKGRDSRWVVCEDGVVRLALLAKGPAAEGGQLSFAKWAPAGFDYVPSGGGQPFDVAAFGAAAPELADQPSIFDLALAA